ncbi:hypothetical protein PHYPSEUDO_009199 [Phytophthora pseudosyringae]|uniref:DUF4211 domain-containing protein n=1 Tax=Phytophthora pseudosyringae TaxID=221518 RepID=A0A8T1W9K1_9STRA|nr:hypothetical protein PHYPSEUDO_009199 [Phytophthora pseudosyringae]
MAEHEEVVIDGDSTEEDEEVTIITPESRKRRRRSNIMADPDEEDEEDGDEAEQDATEKAKNAAPHRQQQLFLGKDGVSSQPMTLRTLTPTRRNMQQLSISAAVARGEQARRQQQGGGGGDKEDAQEEEDDDDDEVRVIPPPSASSVGSSGRKSRRPATQDSDEEMEPNQKEQEQQDADMEQDVEVDEASSASRRSSRIEHKRQEKEKQHASARKLDYPLLDNCLDTLQSLGPHFNGGDGEEEDDEYQESEPEEALPPPPKKRRRSVPREGDRDGREKVYADAGDDVDDFICGDDEIEYMNDDEEGVISVESSDDEVGDDDPEELTAILEAGRSREITEWFEIYMAYLEECVIDPDFKNNMRRKRSKVKFQLYEQAVNRIERKLCSCRDTVRSGVAWPEDMVDALRHASLFRSSRVSAEQDCEACNRRQHVATYHVELAGYACDATKLYGSNWMGHLKEAVKEAAPVQISFEMGSVCHARTLAYWQMLHAKQFWCILIDAKLKQCADSTGKIAEQYRNEFIKTEFGRYKRLVELVEKFAEDLKRLNFYMPNVWKKISRRNVTSDFLPLPSRVRSCSISEPRRGTLDAFVAESEEEETEDEEAMMEKNEVAKRAAANVNNDVDQGTDEEEESKGMEGISPRQPPRSETKKEQKLQLATKEEEKKEGTQTKDEKSVPEKDIDDLMCLVCDASPRNAGVVHGLYLHVYCCYACAKRQLRMKCGCMVCNRPIDRVLRLLPLTLDARNAIRNQQKKS